MAAWLSHLTESTPAPTRNLGNFRQLLNYKEIDGGLTRKSRCTSGSHPARQRHGHRGLRATSR